MKRLFKLWIFVGLFLNLFMPNNAFSQAGLTNSGMTQQQETMELMRQKSGNGFDTGTKGGSALQQLENMAGTNIRTSNTSTRTVAAPVVRAISTNAMIQNAVKMQIASGIASAFIGMIFSSNSQSNAQAAEEQRQQAILLAQKAAEEKRIADLIAQEKYDQMMKSYKLLNNSNGLQVKTLSTSSLQFKSLDQSAPLTREERELQNIRNHLGKDGKPISLTWNSNEWFNTSPNSNMIEETSTQEESEEDKKFNDVISKHESDRGGRAAALVGRFGKHLKNEVISYLKEATDAVVSGNTAVMERVGQDDAKIMSNTLKGTIKETGSAAYNEVKGKVIGYFEGARDEAVKDVVMEVAPKGAVDAWKLTQ